MSDAVKIVDRLEETAVVINIRVLPGKPNQGRDERELVLTLGIPEKETLFRSGTMSQLDALINDAWTAYATVAMQETAVSQQGEVLGSAQAEPAEFTYSDDDF